MNNIEFKLTKQYVYKKCVERVEARRKSESPIKPQIALCVDDKSLVSCFFNCKCTVNNKYLITKRLLNYHSKTTDIECGAVPVFHFRNEHEVLWGSEEEFKENLFTIFSLILKDVLDYEKSGSVCLNREEYYCKIKNKFTQTLSDNIIFAKYSTLYQIKEQHNVFLLEYFGVYDDVVAPDKMNEYLIIALKQLFKKEGFENAYTKIFKNFTERHKDYTHIDRRIEKEFLPELLSLLAEYQPPSNSLGLRVKNLIETDLVKSIEQFDFLEAKLTSEFHINKALIHASSQYITQLEEIAYMLNGAGMQLDN